MPCPVCKRLERTFEGWNTECIRARSSLYVGVSSRFAACDFVEMERARRELQMHRSVCVIGLAQAIAQARAPRLASVASSRKIVKIVPPRRTAQPLPAAERLTTSAILTAA
jgi:hypothetical protein